MALRNFAKWIVFAAALLTAVRPGWAQNPTPGSNGRNYTPQIQWVGERAQSSYDLSVKGIMLTVPVKTGAGPYSRWGLFHITEAVADTTGTNHHGMALFSPAGVKLCSVYNTVSTTVGDNAYNLNNCGVPAANSTYTLAYLSDWSSEGPGFNENIQISDYHCPGTTSYSGYVSQSAFPSTLPSLSPQKWCYTFWAEVVLASGSNGKYYGGNAGLNEQVTSIPTGPWKANGTWYGGLNTADTFVNMSDGLSNGVAVTTTALGNASHGTSCTWALGSADNVIFGSNQGHKNLITPVSVGGVAYGGSGTLSYVYNTQSGALRNEATCTFASSYSSFSLGFHMRIDMPLNDAISNDYDLGGIQSADGQDYFVAGAQAGGSSFYMNMQCEHSGATANAHVINLIPNTNYWVYMLKTTGGATQYEYVFNQDLGGAFAGLLTCASYTGSHPSNTFYTTVNGSETNTAGHHVWEDHFEVSTTGAFLAP